MRPIVGVGGGVIVSVALVLLDALASPLAVVLPVRVTSSLIEEVSVDVYSSDMEARVRDGSETVTLAL